MTIEQAIAALHAAGLADAHFRHGSINFICRGKLCGIRTDHRAMVKTDDVAFWVGESVMARKLKPDAERIAARFKAIENPSWETLRDYCDGATQGDLDCIELDILTDMVERRIKENRA